MTDFLAVLTNPVALAALPHTLFAAFMMTAGVIISISAWHLARRQNVEMMRSSLRYGLWGMIVAFAGVALSGDQLSLVMVRDAADEDGRGRGDVRHRLRRGCLVLDLHARHARTARASCSRSACPTCSRCCRRTRFDGCVEGINDLNALYATEMFPQFADQVDGNFAPILWITYWSFRWMIGLGGIAALTAVVGLWLTRKKAKRDVPVWAWRLAIWAWPASLLAILVGWIFTEMGRQPWIVFSLMLTEDGVSPSVPGWTVLISLVAFTADLRGRSPSSRSDSS